MCPEPLLEAWSKIASSPSQHSIACENTGERTVQRGVPIAARSQRAEGGDEATGDRVADN
jgi:hypothetical protein